MNWTAVSKEQSPATCYLVQGARFWSERMARPTSLPSRALKPDHRSRHTPLPLQPHRQEEKALLTPEVLTLVRDLVRAEKTFEPNLAGLMALRKQKQEEIYANILAKRPALTFPAETKCVHVYGQRERCACLCLGRNCCGCGCSIHACTHLNTALPNTDNHTATHREIREGAWRSETIRPANMADRACENTHPSRAANMAIHGLNSKACSCLLLSYMVV